jgi:prevent-host-death family protein
MHITNDIKPVTYLKAKTAELLKQVNETQRPVIITQNGEARAVLQDARSYEEMRNVIGLLKLVSQGEADVREGKYTVHDDLFERLEKELQRR